MGEQNKKIEEFTQNKIDKSKLTAYVRFYFIYQS